MIACDHGLPIIDDPPLELGYANGGHTHTMSSSFPPHVPGLTQLNAGESVLCRASQVPQYDFLITNPPYRYVQLESGVQACDLT